MNQFDINRVQISVHENPKERWHLYQVNISKEEIYSLAKHMVGTWYMHFWKGTTIIAVFSGNHIFEFDYDNKSTWDEVLKYGRSIGITEA